jgi:hypothetical protein
MISKRTKEALAAAKQRGVVLGNPNVGRMNSEAAMAREAVLKPILKRFPADLNRRDSQRVKDERVFVH